MLELLWHRYWVSTLSSSPLVANVAYNAGQLRDVAEKIEQAETQVSRGWHAGIGAKGKGDKDKEETQLARAARDATKTSVEQLTGLISLVAKDALFNTPASL